MKVTELRIGNIVETINGVQSVMGIDTSDEHGEYVMFNDGRKFGHYIEHQGELLVKPIPLTEGWLERFGFSEFTDHIRQGTIRSFELESGLDPIITAELRHEEVGLIWVSINDCDGHGDIHTPVQYVHQLQNLYFALTGEELELRK